MCGRGMDSLTEGREVEWPEGQRTGDPVSHPFLEKPLTSLSQFPFLSALRAGLGDIYSYFQL